ncbi:MAG TPA: ATP-binding protein [Pyrinomonadaceae bacterium]|nr:ATP-binding protein [Pyrinomonadaceae bacterium]
MRRRRAPWKENERRKSNPSLLKRSVHASLRILHLEDDHLDAELVRETLAVDGLIAQVECVDTRTAYIAALQNADFDLILADYTLPSFDGSSALAIATEKRPEIPFIFVSGSLGEEVAIESLKSGATDYVLKHRLQRLAHAVHRAIAERDERKRRKLASEALQASEARYRQLFESNPLPMWVFDLETLVFLAVNEAATSHYGYSREQFLAMTIKDIRPPEDIPALLAGIAKRPDGLDAAGTWRHLRRDGTIIDVEITSHSIWFAERSAEIVLANDVTERKRSEDALRESNSELEKALAQLHTKQAELTAKTEQLWQASKLATMGELAASIAHELNNPLATIALRTEALVGQLWQDTEKRRALEIVLKEVDRMATLVNNLLLFSRRSYRQVSTVDLRDEITTSFDFLSYHLRKHKVDVVFDFNTEVSTIQADRQQLRQLFLNLLTNACDAMPDGGKLTIRVQPVELKSAPAVTVEFEDTGEGIAASDLDAIWDPFFTTKPEGKGTGLGMAICRRIVEEHGGVISIESGEGTGTTVRIVFPATANGMSERDAEKVIFIE